MVPITRLSGRLGNQMFQLAFIYAKVKDGLIPDIYVQDPKYFKSHEADIQSLFGTSIGSLPYVAIHVRRTDYVGNDFYIDLSQTDYYRKAIALFPNSKFLVFSDDPDYVRTLDWAQGEDVKILEKGEEVTDFNLMASCASQIIANSSYSWWAAYLNRNKDKKVVAPSVKNWYSDGKERTICPENWIRI